MSIITGLPDYSEGQIQSIVFSHLQHLKESLFFEDLDFSVQVVRIFGSRVSGKSRNTSDLDIKIRYTGTVREDDLFNALNEINTRLYIEEIRLDFYPEKL